MLKLHTECNLYSHKVTSLTSAVDCQLAEKEVNSTSGCFGTTSDISFWMKLTCEDGEDIAVIDATVSIQPDSQNCSYLDIFSKYEECCKANTNCLFSYPFQDSILNTVTIPEHCNGNQACLTPIPQIPRHASCDSNTYPYTSANYMHINYVCIPSKTTCILKRNRSQNVLAQSRLPSSCLSIIIIPRGN